MIEVYAIEIENKKSEKNRKIQLISSSHSDSPLTVRSSTSRSPISMAGMKFVRKIIAEKYDCPAQEITFSQNASGKPFCTSPTGCHFNISHSGSWIVCAIDEKPVGIDIQEMIDISNSAMDRIVARFFNPEEQSTYVSFQLNKKREFFFTHWALKESYMKYKGIGFGIPIHSICLNVKSGEMRFVGDYDETSYFHQYFFDNKYKIIACGSHSQFADTVRKISITM